jgi:gliding motility-associated protein GldM
MALPAEPRQKMINIMYLVLTAILALNVSAEILNAFKVVDSSLAKSNTAIDGSNNTLFESLKQKLDKAETREKAQIWEPRAQQAKKLADELYNSIEAYKSELKKASGLNDAGEFKEDDLDAATRVFIEGGKGKLLKDNLEDFQKKLLAIAPEIQKEFGSKLPIDLSVPASKSGNGEHASWEYSYFHMTPTIAAITILSKFQNDIKNAENKAVNACHNQIGKVDIVYNKFQAIAGANATYLMPGQELVITAGVGAFNDQAKPTVTIGGTTIGLNENGVAEKKFNVTGSGNQKVHVTVKFFNQSTGKEETLDKDIDYTVGTPGGAAIMLDKMNVFYIGVPNPITISSGSGWDKTQVSMTGGTLSGTNGNRTVTVTTPGTASITVNADGKTSKFDFRVKVIPDPIGMVGPSKGGRMQSNIFKAQDFIRAELLNFDFDARFNVTSATVYFAGAGFTTGGGVQTGTLTSGSLAPIKAKMDLCKPGSTVTFDDLKVVGPDGRSRTIPPVSFVLF